MQLIEHPGAKPRRKSRRSVAVSLLVIAALAGGGVYYWQTRPVAKPVARQAPAIPVTVTAAASRDVPIYLDALGTTSAANTVTIRSQITGTLQTVNFTEGQEVKQGDTLTSIAFRYGFSPGDLWDAQQNASLRSKRSSASLHSTRSARCSSSTRRRT